MKLKFLIDEDFINYKKPSLFIGCPKCSFKCCIEAKNDICQNSSLSSQPDIEISIDKIVNRYLDNNISEAIVLGGLEPLDSWKDILGLIEKLREFTSDDIVIYTGYKEDEIKDKVELLKQFSNIIIKFGRFIPDQPLHKDETLGVNLASPNQYAVKIS